MIKASGKFSTSADEKLNDAVESLIASADAAWEDASRAMLEELRKVPRKRVYPREYPLEWTSYRQRVAYWATNGFGAGIPYQRSGKMSAGWGTDKRVEKLGVTYGVFNRYDRAKFVYGALRGELAYALKFKQYFHTVTGWQNAREIVDKHVDSFLDAIRWKRAVVRRGGKRA